MHRQRSKLAQKHWKIIAPFLHGANLQGAKLQETEFARCLEIAREESHTRISPEYLIKQGVIGLCYCPLLIKGREMREASR